MAAPSVARTHPLPCITALAAGTAAKPVRACSIVRPSERRSVEARGIHQQPHVGGQSLSAGPRTTLSMNNMHQPEHLITTVMAMRGGLSQGPGVDMLNELGLFEVAVDPGDWNA